MDKTGRSRAEARRLREDRAYWKELEDYLPWRLYRFSYRSSASFFTCPTLSDATIELKGHQRDQILEAIWENGEGG